MPKPYLKKTKTVYVVFFIVFCILAVATAIASVTARGSVTKNLDAMVESVWIGNWLVADELTA